MSYEDGRRPMTQESAGWDHPILLGNRLCWWPGPAVPVVAWMPLHTDDSGEDFNENGFHATLPTENGATVEVTFDPDDDDDPSTWTTMWLYVRQPQTEALIGAHPDGDRAVYDPACGGYACEGCSWCGIGQGATEVKRLVASLVASKNSWMEYVTSSEQILDRLRWLGSLRVAMRPT